MFITFWKKKKWRKKTEKWAQCLHRSKYHSVKILVWEPPPLNIGIMYAKWISLLLQPTHTTTLGWEQPDISELEESTKTEATEFSFEFRSYLSKSCFRVLLNISGVLTALNGLKLLVCLDLFFLLHSSLELSFETFENCNKWE